MDRARLIEGYQAPIHRALWERITTMGAPRLWAAVWLAGCLYATLLMLTVTGFRLAIVPLVIWAIGQGTLMLLSQIDASWDDVIIAQLTRRYKSYYDAG